MSLLPTMLGIRAGMRVSVLNAPEGFIAKLAPLPEGAALLDASPTGIDLTVYFATKKVELLEKLPVLARGMSVMGHIWVCYPGVSDSSAVPSEDFVRIAGLEVGLVDDKKLVLEDGWVALRLAWKPRAPRLEKPQIQA